MDRRGAESASVMMAKESSSRDEVQSIPVVERTLGVCGNAVTQRDGQWYTHHSFGRIVALLAPRFRALQYHAKESPSAGEDTCDYPLAGENITVHPWPPYRNTMHAMKRPDRLLRGYWHMVQSSDALFLRGSAPLIWQAHWLARLRGRPVVHWVVGNPPAILRGEQRGYGRWMTRLGIYFAQFEQLMTRISTKLCGARVLTNGAELARIFRSRRTVEVVSTSIDDDDFLVREDTCQGDTIRVLFVGFVRPEKGLEYLLRALPQVESGKPVHLAIVGSWDKFSGEKERLDRMIEELGLRDRVSWEGYAPFGTDLFDQMDRSDVLVLPSLSEGTPRVLVEARARSLPVIATNVGGIPSSVADGKDGLLVPPRDPVALAACVSRIVNDLDLRVRLIRDGREKVKAWTVGRFVDLVVDSLVSRGNATTNRGC